MRDLRREIRKAALVKSEDLILDPDLEPSFEHMDRLLLRVVHVERWAAVRCDLDDEVVQGAGGVISGELEDEVAARTRLQAKAVVGAENDVSGCCGGWHGCPPG